MIWYYGRKSLAVIKRTIGRLLAKIGGDEGRRRKRASYRNAKVSPNYRAAWDALSEIRFT